MAQQIPPPPPGFSIVGGGAPRSVPRAAPRQASRYNGPMPGSAEALFPALIRQESGGQAGILGPQTRYGQAIGRTQMLPATAREVAQKIGVPYREDLLRGTSPEAAQYQDRLGLAYLQEGFERTGNDRDALHYYHGGPNRALWGPKTRAYADSILSMWSKGQGETPALGEAVQTAAGAPPPPPGFQIVGDAATPSGAPIEVEIDEGVQNVNGRAILAGEDVGSWESFQARNRRSNEENVKRAEREADPEYQRRYADASSRAENIPDWLLSLTGGATLGGSGLVDEIIGGMDYIGSGFDATAGQAARDAIRDEQAEFASERPGLNLALQIGGGFATPGLGAAGNFISRGTGAARLGRAAAVGGGFGAGSGLANAEGDLGERLPDAALGAVTGAGVGAVGQRGVDRITAALANRATTSAARRLSRQGVDLTPGQMMSEVPGVGSTVKYVEDIAGGFNPLMNGVRRRQNEDVVRAAGNEALANVGRSLPRDARTGYQVSQNVMKVLGAEYDDVTAQITAQADAPLYTELQDMVRRAGETLDDSHASRLERILDQNILSRFGQGGDLSGSDFKRIETTLRQQSERANRPNSTLEDVDLSEFLDETRDIMRNLIARQYPEQAERIQNINRGYAIGKRVQRAVSGSPQMAREGTPLPGELTQTVQQMTSDSQIASQTGLLQGLASDARTVLPASVADTGSGQRAVLGAMGVAATGGAAVVSPGLAAAIAAGAVVYSRPGIAALNAVYRATDSRQASVALQELERIAARNPALLPYYEDALRRVRDLASPDTEAAQPMPTSVASPTLVR